MSDEDIRATLEQHWSVSLTEGWQKAVERTHRIYDEDVVVEWPQSGERILGLGNLKALREAYPAKLTFEIQRIRGRGALWVTEYVISQLRRAAGLRGEHHGVHGRRQGWAGDDLLCGPIRGTGVASAVG
jgi:hypothetical protein